MFTKTDLKLIRHTVELGGTSRCLRANIAALIAKNGKILVEYCNHPMSLYDCTKIGCIRNICNLKSGERREICYGLCAEQYAIALAAEKGIETKGTTIYVSKHPCRICECLICVAGISKVVFCGGYPDVLPNFQPFQDYGVQVVQVPEKYGLQVPTSCHPGQRTCD